MQWFVWTANLADGFVLSRRRLNDFTNVVNVLNVLARGLVGAAGCVAGIFACLAMAEGDGWEDVHGRFLALMKRRGGERGLFMIIARLGCGVALVLGGIC